LSIIEVENLSKSFGTVQAVRNISFKVEEGEIFGFLGPNGAGKTTTIRMLTGVLEPTKGLVKIFGQDYWKNPIPIKQEVGDVSELANVYIDLTGWYNLNFIGQLYGIPKRLREQRAEDLLKQFDLYEKRNLKAKTYSRGMKQRLLICMALLSNPKILFLDEPTSGLDVQSSIIIKQLIRDYNKKGMTIFLTTHNMGDANELCQRIAIINKGKIVSLNTPENLRKIFQENHAIDVVFNKEVSKEVIEKITSIKQIEKTKEGWRLIVNEVNQGIMEITDFAKESKIEIVQLNTPEPSLEEVFLKIIKRGE
jgi:ABC-2 type transport system ATP-binding protein